MQSELIKTELDAFSIYLLFKDDPHSFFLDSGMDSEKLGRYSFIGSSPFCTFAAKNGTVVIDDNKAGRKEIQGDPFLLLKELLQRYHQEDFSSFPLSGAGAVGFFSYDLCHYIEKLPATTVDDAGIPDCWLGFYDGIVVVDHWGKQVWLTARGIREDASAVIRRLRERIKAGETHVPAGDFSINASCRAVSNFAREDYLKAIERIREYILAGDIYQANMTQRFSCPLTVHPVELYRHLRQINPAPFASLIDFGPGWIVSSSPERFFSLRQGIAETRPIKGTRPRGKTPEEDTNNREELLASEKDRAELLMIVDLERNDLGRLAEPGSVEVTELFQLEEYPTVWHLVATVRAKLAEGYDIIDCLRAAFPGGSITGAPKIRAMEIIDELEPTRRNIYTGSIGYIDFNGDADLNIVIRTIVAKDGKAWFQAGGGIVWDSDPAEEYEETLHKGRALFNALNASL